ncbi:Na+/H+ antiporter NhaC [Pisciglobus halotolerans]|uniref:Putative tyrosine permease, NhaC family n=1 Tax=Pisciglobus halotolerans TaxID=745365 RepID=A0A1I3BNV4_9LACT|nr:Na+/H+ antiporter NhaC [Pisciglobus halotolerans]SFH63952.1 putative tyrosine permease, NhaC family [Pisciglobus halotolerans]
MNQKNQPSITEATIVLSITVFSIALGVVVLQLSPPIAILFAIAVIMIYAAIKKIPFEQLHEGIINGIKPGIIPIFIFILVGALIAIWIQAGIIPTLMVYGFKIISVKWFVPSVFIACAIVGSAVGSAFTVMSTIGIAFFGIGITLGIHPPLIVGAIASGAVFGDKMSPLSESTNLAAAIAEVDLFKHIQHLLWSTIPAFLVSLVLFSILGMTSQSMQLVEISEVVQVLENNFSISLFALVPLFLMFVCAWKKIPAIMTILINIGVAILFILFQNQNTSVSDIATALESGYVSTTGHQQIDLLLSRGGIESMMPTVSLIILTLSLGGLLMETGLITTVMSLLSKKIRSISGVVTATLLTSIGVNLFIGEQFLSVILPGNAFKKIYKDNGVDLTVLSRTLEDGGTVINYLVPWGIAGSFVASTFDVPTLAYLPFAFFSLLSPLFSLLSAWTGWGISMAEGQPNGENES